MVWMIGGVMPIAVMLVWLSLVKGGGYWGLYVQRFCSLFPCHLSGTSVDDYLGNAMLG